MAEGRKCGNVNNLTVFYAIEIRVKFPAVKEMATPGTKILILADTADGHDPALKNWIRIEAFALPFAARDTLGEAVRSAVFLVTC